MEAFAKLAPTLGRHAVYEMPEDVLEQVADRADDEPASAGGKRKLKRKSPTSRTLDECRDRGWTAGVVEKFVKFPPPGHHVDLFGVIDVVAIDLDTVISCGGCGRNQHGATIGIQACAGSGHAARRAKILAEPRARQWIDAGNRLELWSWTKRGSHFERGRWTLRVEAFTLDSAWTFER